MRRAVLGVDLAAKSWRANGTAILEFDTGGEWIGARAPAAHTPRGPVTVEAVADWIDTIAAEEGVAAVSIDAPQGWRDPRRPLHEGVGRACERATAAPGKTLTRGLCKPSSAISWVALGIGVFAELRARGAEIANDPAAGEVPAPPAERYLLAESFPTSTWRAARLEPLPPRRRRPDIHSYARGLWHTFGLPLEGLSAASHDDLQAVVAALPAAALVGGPSRALPRGVRGSYHEGAWVEGLIWDAVPTREARPAEPNDERPLLVLVTGPPGGGKTTLAGPLARELGLPLVGRDELKEVLYAELGTGDIEWTQRLGRASFALLFLTASRLLAAGSSLVLEANFFRGVAEHELERLPAHRLVQVHCSAPADVVLARFAQRAGRHPGHLDAQRADEVAARLRDGAHDPLYLPGAVLTVDTTEPVSAATLAAEIRDAVTRFGSEPD